MEETSNKWYFKITKAWKRNNVIDLPHKEKYPHPHMWLEGSFSSLGKDLLSKFEKLPFFSFWNCRYVLFKQSQCLLAVSYKLHFCKENPIFYSIPL